MSCLSREVGPIPVSGPRSVGSGSQVVLRVSPLTERPGTRNHEPADVVDDKGRLCLSRPLALNAIADLVVRDGVFVQHNVLYVV